VYGECQTLVPGDSGQHCAVGWWGGGCAAGVHWSDVALVHPFQTWMSLPVVCHARESLERAAAALQLEREKCADKEEELWAGYKKFVRRQEGSHLSPFSARLQLLWPQIVRHAFSALSLRRCRCVPLVTT